MSAHAYPDEHPKEMFLAHLGASFDAESFAKNDEALADESTWWRSGFGVVCVAADVDAQWTRPELSNPLTCVPQFRGSF